VQVLNGLRLLAAILRVLRLSHLRYDCMYSRPQLYVNLRRLESNPDIGGGLFDVFCEVRCCSYSCAVRVGRESSSFTLAEEDVRRAGFDMPFRNTCHLVVVTCAYLRVLSRFVRRCRNLFDAANTSIVSSPALP